MSGRSSPSVRRLPWPLRGVREGSRPRGPGPAASGTYVDHRLRTRPASERARDANFQTDVLRDSRGPAGARDGPDAERTAPTVRLVVLGLLLLWCLDASASKVPHTPALDVQSGCEPGASGDAASRRSSSRVSATPRVDHCADSSHGGAHIMKAPDDARRDRLAQPVPHPERGSTAARAGVRNSATSLPSPSRRRTASPARSSQARA